MIMFNFDTPSEVIEAQRGTARTRVTQYFNQDQVHAGLWECWEGSFDIDAHPVHEVCHILEGTALISQADGSQTEVTAGDAFFIPKGTPTFWKVDTFIKKVYMVAP